MVIGITWTWWPSIESAWVNNLVNNRTILNLKPTFKSQRRTNTCLHRKWRSGGRSEASHWVLAPWKVFKKRIWMIFNVISKVKIKKSLKSNFSSTKRGKLNANLKTKSVFSKISSLLSLVKWENSNQSCSNFINNGTILRTFDWRT